MGWLNEVFPDNEQWQKFSNGVVSITEKLKDSIEIGKLRHHCRPAASIYSQNSFRSTLEATWRGENGRVAAMV